jgi:hypothetical protein
MTWHWISVSKQNSIIESYKKDSGINITIVTARAVS